MDRYVWNFVLKRQIIIIDNVFQCSAFFACAFIVPYDIMAVKITL